MLNPSSIESLDFALEQMSQISDSLIQLKRRLNSVVGSISKDCESSRGCGCDGNNLSPAQVAHLLQMNRHLATLQAFLVEKAATLSPTYAAKVADQTDPMADYEIEAQLCYTLREDDPDYLEDEDNILTRRLELLKHPRLFAWRDDYRETVSMEMDDLNSEAHCWLFHDLHDHSHGLTGPSVQLKDCLRIGAVSVDIVIRQQYSLNLDTGMWESW